MHDFHALHQIYENPLHMVQVVFNLKANLNLSYELSLIMQPMPKNCLNTSVLFCGILTECRLKSVYNIKSVARYPVANFKTYNTVTIIKDFKWFSNYNQDFMKGMLLQKMYFTHFPTYLRCRQSAKTFFRVQTLLLQF